MERASQLHQLAFLIRLPDRYTMLLEALMVSVISVILHFDEQQVLFGPCSAC